MKEQKMIKRQPKTCIECKHVYYKKPHSTHKQFNKSILCSWQCHWKLKKRQKGYWLGKKRPDLKLPHFWKIGEHTGVNHHNWKGGITDERNRERNTLEQRQWRRSVFKRDNYTCISCKKRGGNLVADHYPYPFYKYPDKRLDTSNGRTLCEKCNKIKTYKDKEWLYA